VAKLTASCGFVYFMQAGDAGLIKIGWALNPAYRRSQLQTGSADLLRIIGAFEADQTIERAIHRQLKHLHSHGEWFKPTAEIRKLMREYGALLRPDRREKERAPFTDQCKPCTNCGSKFAGIGSTGMCGACYEFAAIRDSSADPFAATPEEETTIASQQRKRERIELAPLGEWSPYQ
jgi:hypothetical protein